MITVEAQISGEQIARQLVQDEEEMARALVEMRENVRDARILGAELADHLTTSDIHNVVTFLRELADGMEEK